MTNTEQPSVMEHLASSPKIRIPDMATHSACQCYQKNRVSGHTIRQKSLVAGKGGKILSDVNNIVFVLGGSLRISTYYAHEGTTVRQNDMFFLPLGAKFDYEAMEDGALLIFSFDKSVHDIPECHTFRFQRDHKLPSTKFLPEIYPLPANDRILEFIYCVLATERDGLKCSNYARLLVSQLMVLIQAYYSQSDYTRFYSAILSGDVKFSDFVYGNWERLHTARMMADGLHMSERQFIERFRNTFGDTPGSWLQQRKRGSIYQELCSSDGTLKEVAFRYGFSMPNFVRYCRTNYGQSPGQIRKQLKTETPAAAKSSAAEG